MVTVEMAEKNNIEAPRIEAGSFHPQQCRRPTVHEKESIGGFNEITALIAAAITESISTTDNVKLHHRFCTAAV